MLFSHANLATLAGDMPYGFINDGIVAVEGGLIRFSGPRSALPIEFFDHEEIDLGGRLLTPSLIDAHTHLIYGGNRSLEFEMRLEGKTYEEIARAGGGILSTVSQTRKLSVPELTQQALSRLDSLLDEGVGTIEIKSGYGLDCATEINMLRAARALADKRPVRIKTSFLGAHAIPPEFTNKPDDYIDSVAIPTLVKAHQLGLVDAVDGFCEHIAFNTRQIERVFQKARDLSLPVKLHAEQLSHQGGVALATNYHAMSADHVEYATHKDAFAMARAGTTAVLLPGAFYVLKETKKPPVDRFRQAGVPMVVATDCNPGSSPMTSLLLAMNMACTFFGLTPEEALNGTTRHAARALGIKDSGVIEPGMRADFAVWDTEHPRDLSYAIGYNPLKYRYFLGELCWSCLKH